MNWIGIFPGSILGFREGLEAFLIIGIMVKYLEKSKRMDLASSVKTGMVAGIGGSLLLGLVLWRLMVLLGRSSEDVGSLWASIASITGLLLLSTFIFWMMKHGRTVSSEIREQVEATLSRRGIMGLAAVVVLREGVEIVLFAFSSVDEQAYVLGILIGILASGTLSYLIYLSLVRVNLGILFTITLSYLVLQAGYLLGYAIHEFLSAMKSLGKLAPEQAVLAKAFDLKNTILDHKTGALGVPLNVVLGWYSRPEWVQLVLHYGYVSGMFLLWKRLHRDPVRE